jgi:hypothetical protein
MQPKSLKPVDISDWMHPSRHFPKTPVKQMAVYYLLLKSSLLNNTVS